MEWKDFLIEPRIIDGSCVKVPGAKVIALDPGKSSMKGRTDNLTFLLQNAAEITQNEGSFRALKKTDVFVKNENGTFVVGEIAAALIAKSSSANFEDELYGKNRYAYPRFRAILEASLALSLQSNNFGSWTPGTRIVLGIGLAPGERRETFMEETVIDNLAGHYQFEARFGNKAFEKYDFTIRKEDIYVMDQPMGALISCITNGGGRFNHDQEHLLQETSLVMDTGFRTLDLYPIAGGVLAGKPRTFDNLAMMEVYESCIRDIKENYGNTLTLSEFQYAVKKGFFMAGNWHRGQARKTRVEDILIRNSMAVCNMAIDKILNLYDGLQEYSNLVIAGGTGNVWMPIIRSRFRDMDGISIISANRNETNLPNVFSNVRGFYYFTSNRLLKKRPAHSRDFKP